MEKRKILVKASKIASTVLLYVFIAICILALMLTIFSKKDADGAVTVLGKQIRFVLSPSMEECEFTDVSNYEIKDIPKGALVFIDVVPEDEAERAEWYEDVKVGDVLTFRYVYQRQETITHRVTAKEPNGKGGYLISLQGDNRNSPEGVLTQVVDTSNVSSPNYIIGRVTGTNYPLGLLVTAMKSPIAIICIVIIPAMAIIVLEVLRIINILNADKRKAEESEKKKKDDELAELKRRLAELQAEKAESETASDTEPPTVEAEENVINGDEP